MATRYYIDPADANATPAVLDRRDLACRQDGVDPEWFYPGPGGSPARAIGVCKRCPAVGDCLQWALDSGQRFGVWGGTTDEDRNRLKAAGGNAGTGWPT